MRVSLAIKQIKHPIVLALILYDRVLVAIEIFPTEPKAHLDPTGDRLGLGHRVRLELIEVMLNLILVIIFVLHVGVVLDWESPNGFARWLVIFMVCAQRKHRQPVILRNFNTFFTEHASFLAGFFVVELVEVPVGPRRNEIKELFAHLSTNSIRRRICVQINHWRVFVFLNKIIQTEVHYYIFM